MIDKTEIKSRFRKSVETYDDNAHVQKLIVDRLCTLLEKYTGRTPGRILEIGCGTGLLTNRILRQWHPGEMIVNDLVEEMCYKTINKNSGNALTLSCLPGDIEEISLDGTFDLIVSTSTFQWFTHPRQTFEKLASHLRPGGLLLFTTFGEQNLHELRQVTGKGLNYLSGTELTKMLAAYFDVTEREESLETLYFSDPLDILRHVKKTGVNATGKTEIWTKLKIELFAQKYSCYFLSGGKYPLTYHPLYFVCRKSS